tara:strand:- start:12263 stop:12742 length:480 start_codon:yes stop_codon:yes gene_type:complete
MKNHENLIFYSINSKLAHHINTNYYSNTHYVWVAPYFNCEKTNPSSSNPKDIYKNFKKDLKKGKIDYHSLNIANNRVGIKKGAILMCKSKNIDENTKSLIIALSQKAEAEHFRPIIYVIPAEKVLNKVETPDLTIKANSLSLEYIIPSLKSEEFDIIEL